MAQILSKYNYIIWVIVNLHMEILTDSLFILIVVRYSTLVEPDWSEK